MTAVRRLGWWVLGGTLVVVGALTAVLARPESPDLGWFAYTPLAEDARGTENADWAMSSSLDLSFDGAALVTWWQVAGVALAVLGLLVLVGRAAYLLGRGRLPVNRPGG